jgi:hypothetical protein
VRQNFFAKRKEVTDKESILSVWPDSSNRNSLSGKKTPQDGRIYRHRTGFEGCSVSLASPGNGPLSKMNAAAAAGTDWPILLILTGEDCSNAVQAAFEHARSTSKRLRVIQILSSDLYHYGHQDLVATRPSKRQFLLHIREEVLVRGKAEARALEDKAREMGVSLGIETIESEDVYAASLAEAKKGRDIIFLPKQEKKLFPIFKRTLAQYLKKKIPIEIVSC